MNPSPPAASITYEAVECDSNFLAKEANGSGVRPTSGLHKSPDQHHTATNLTPMTNQSTIPRAKRSHLDSNPYSSATLPELFKDHLCLERTPHQVIPIYKDVIRLIASYNKHRIECVSDLSKSFPRAQMGHKILESTRRQKMTPEYMLYRRR
ncbi:uncharacterized protein BCR38DRAFT_412220 [Pseudomassariella vexata]|uniref:Uncharacterized protein n=1 Tax=Pseudomassariella vexata TaxID=1141098 RepID=A0A1Y2DLB1_9PEZI|nr:uncharacterized protein BCR38DRAFT_412220 [Pseudomassariella vexata]ORY60011.1 hypothetical protein BCR38DRAFT_412220 [Pseudomassariella vexata]